MSSLRPVSGLGTTQEGWPGGPWAKPGRAGTAGPSVGWRAWGNALPV